MKSEPFILISVPLEMFLEAGINTENVIQMSVHDGKIIIDTPDTTSDYVCDRDCESCPLNAMPCEFDCENCPCEANCDGRGDDYE
ncbi:MAG: hypothetical protein HFE93_07860 [Acutalibacter muris]|nr:hypothetical protein [Acutalibacter muris]MCI9544091.1 hypothetical protein [Acutalibacter muris]